MYHFGGFYLELGVFLASSLSDLSDFSCVLSFEELTINMFLRQEYRMDCEIGNYVFNAAAGHPFAQAVIKNCVRAQENPEWLKVMMTSIPLMFRGEFYVFYTTGPGLVFRTFAKMGIWQSKKKSFFRKMPGIPGIGGVLGDLEFI
jgi:hypothetical protein